jgi:hypothetical protein
MTLQLELQTAEPEIGRKISKRSEFLPHCFLGQLAYKSTLEFLGFNMRLNMENWGSVMIYKPTYLQSTSSLWRV